MSWNFSCPGWVERLRTGRSLVPDLPLDAAEAARAVGIFNKLRLPDVPGQPSFGEAGGDWFRDIIRAIFGSLETNEAGVLVRRVPECFLLVPKKNSKTTNAAALALVTLLLNTRPRGEVILVGPTQDIANRLFAQAQGMIEADEDGYLQTRFHIREHLKKIVDRTNKGALVVKTFDMTVMTGALAIAVILDELHIMSTFSYASRVIQQIRGAMLPRKEGLLFFITTQSDLQPAGAFKAELGLARGIRDGTVTGEAVRMLPVLYEFPEEMQTDEAQPWADPAYWPMVLPNLGRSITLDRLAADYAAAREKGIEEECRWASQHLNVEIGLALHNDRWRGADYWLPQASAKRSGKRLTLSELLDRSEVVVIGGDGGGDDDLLGMAVLGRDRDTGDWLLWCRAWVDRALLKLRPEIAERLEDFERDGDLTLIDGATQDDLDEFADIVRDIHQRGLLPEKNGVGLDPAGITALVDAIVARQVPQDVLAGISQGYRLQPAIFGTTRKLKAGRLWHDGSAMMAWCVGNAKAVQKGNSVSITKEVAGKAKIDPLIATFNAVFLMAMNPQPARVRSVYEERGMVMLG